MKYLFQFLFIIIRGAVRVVGTALWVFITWFVCALVMLWHFKFALGPFRSYIIFEWKGWKDFFIDDWNLLEVDLNEVEVKDLYEIRWPKYPFTVDISVYRDKIPQQYNYHEYFEHLKSLMPPYYTVKEHTTLFVHLTCNEWEVLVPCGWAAKVDIEDIDWNKVKKA